MMLEEISYHLCCQDDTDVNIDINNNLLIKCVKKQVSAIDGNIDSNTDINIDEVIRRLNNSYKYINEMKCENDILFPILNNNTNIIGIIDIDIDIDIGNTKSYSNSISNSSPNSNPDIVTKPIQYQIISNFL